MLYPRIHKAGATGIKAGEHQVKPGALITFKVWDVYSICAKFLGGWWCLVSHLPSSFSMRGKKKGRWQTTKNALRYVKRYVEQYNQTRKHKLSERQSVPC
jgi:hypothetical protein